MNSIRSEKKKIKMIPELPRPDQAIIYEIVFSADRTPKVYQNLIEADFSEDSLETEENQ